jgi:hypothetical protein
MAITVTALLTAESQTTDAQSTFTTAGTADPTANALVLCVVHVLTASGAWTGSPTMTGGGVSSWTLVESGNAFNQNLMFCFSAVDASATSGQITFNAPAGETWNSLELDCFEVSGAVITGTNGSDAFIQSVNTSQDAGISTTTTMSMDAGGFAAGNGGFAAFGMQTAGTGAQATPRAGWTELKDDGNGESCHTACHWRADSDTAAAATYGTSGNVRVAIALEIADAAAATTRPAGINRGLINNGLINGGLIR